MALNRLNHKSLNPPDEPTREQTTQVACELVTVLHTGEPTTMRWYTDGSKRSRKGRRGDI